MAGCRLVGLGASRTPGAARRIAPTPALLNGSRTGKKMESGSPVARSSLQMELFSGQLPLIEHALWTLCERARQPPPKAQTPIIAQAYRTAEAFRRLERGRRRRCSCPASHRKWQTPPGVETPRYKGRGRGAPGLAVRCALLLAGTSPYASTCTRCVHTAAAWHTDEDAAAMARHPARPSPLS